MIAIGNACVQAKRELCLCHGAASDGKLAAAIDRLIHHRRLVEFNGTSRRMDKGLTLGETLKWKISIRERSVEGIIGIQRANGQGMRQNKHKDMRASSQ